MIRSIFIGLVITLSGNAQSNAPIRMASEPYVTNRLAAAMGSHTNRTDNPHRVTAWQIGALTASETTNAIVALAQPKGPVVALWGTNGTEFATLEPGNVLTQWRVTSQENQSVLQVSSAGTESANGHYVVSSSVAWTNALTGAYIVHNGYGGADICSADGLQLYNYVISQTAPYTGYWTTSIGPYVGDWPAPVTAFGSTLSTNLVSTGLTSTDLANLVAKSYFDSATNTLAAAAEEAYTKGALAQTSINAHSQNGTIGSDKHLLTGDRALIDSVPSKASTNNAAFTGTMTLNGSGLATLAAPVLTVYTNACGAVTLTNVYEAPIYLHATGAVAIAFIGLRAYSPLYLTVRAPASPTWPTNTYFVGGLSFQTNRLNHFGVMSQSPELLVTPITTTE